MATNKNCIVRISRYKNALTRLKSLGFVKVFSSNLADATGTSSAQVRKDFSLFGITGNKRGGYNIDDLVEQMNTIFGKHEVHKVIIVGFGNIGKALMSYKGFEKESIKIDAAFDIDSSKVNEKAEIPVYPFEKLEEYIQENRIKLGVISVPDVAAQQVFEVMKRAGIKGVLNFAPINLGSSDEVVINNINLEMELENLIYYVIAAEKNKAQNNNDI
ncbi:redox-sensing transcriptional repressor Rex [Sedimentisphaera salicampi]|uniref:Redox-sensing transcriptional repressor Rex n=1 Tax=Sedimentisphaera salicampi TaxID=1941349 RepID=A0A1W6LIP1_9BACT|nr:redox-sensing transcriptional repressor Rex [Sedimentisphaera salicampi]ARN55651.1 Redox-sensing transcriptional repressor rex [Sedimentisphaera salicampi]OXU16170.1 Redox-sensing transcriptional repressor rex [Sedimentisphaera salicampi]